MQPWLICVTVSCLIALASSSFAFEIESYELPEEARRRHTTPIYDGSTLYLAGGRINRSETQRNVYELDLSASDPQWEWASDIDESVLMQPWFTTSRGFIKFGDRIYLACHDWRDGKIYEFDVVNASFTQLGAAMNTSDEFEVTEDCCAAGVTTADGEERIYIIGGTQPVGKNPTDQVAYYSIRNDTWTLAGSLNQPRAYHACATYDDGENDAAVYIFGGGNRTAAELNTSAVQLYSSVEIYDVAGDEWTLVPDVLDPPRASFGALSLEVLDSIILVAGNGHVSGHPDGPLPLDLVEVFYVNTNAIIHELPYLGDNVTLPQLNVPRMSPGTILREIEEGEYEVRVIGGQSTSNYFTSVRRDTETWTFQVGNITIPTVAPTPEGFTPSPTSIGRRNSLDTTIYFYASIFLFVFPCL